MDFADYYEVGIRGRQIRQNLSTGSLVHRSVAIARAEIYFFVLKKNHTDATQYSQSFFALYHARQHQWHCSGDYLFQNTPFSFLSQSYRTTACHETRGRRR